MRTRRIQELGLAAAFVIAAGCAAATTDVIPLPISAVTVGPAIRLSLLGDINTFPNATTVLGIPFPGVFPNLNPALCPFNLTDLSFTCPTISLDQIDFSVRFFLYDTAGFSVRILSAPDIATLRTVVDVSGTAASSIGLVPGNASIHHHTDMTLTGLENGALTINGASRINDSVNANGTVPRMTIEATSTANDIRFPCDTSQFPSTGSIATAAVSTAIVGNPPVSFTNTANALLTFNGTSVGTLVTTINGVTKTCLVDLFGLQAVRC